MLLRHVYVAVGGKERAVFPENQGVIRKQGKAQHGLVDLRVAVAAHAEDGNIQPRQHGGDFFGRVVPGQIVPGAVVEHVTQKQQALRLFPGLQLQEPFTPPGRAVDVGGDQQLHAVSPASLASRASAAAMRWQREKTSMLVRRSTMEGKEGAMRMLLSRGSL